MRKHVMLAALASTLAGCAPNPNAPYQVCVERNVEGGMCTRWEWRCTAPFVLNHSSTTGMWCGWPKEGDHNAAK